MMPMYVIPTAPGRSRLLWSFVMPRSSISGLIGLIFMAQPRWVSHLFGTNRVLDGDSALLHAQVCCGQCDKAAALNNSILHLNDALGAP